MLFLVICMSIIKVLFVDFCILGEIKKDEGLRILKDKL